MSWEQEREEIIKALETGTWVLEKWARQPALVARNGRCVAFYHGQEYDPEEFDLMPDAWDHDHCELCFKTITDFVREDNKVPVVDEGYTDGENWVCCECFDKHGPSGRSRN